MNEAYDEHENMVEALMDLKQIPEADRDLARLSLSLKGAGEIVDQIQHYQPPKRDHSHVGRERAVYQTTVIAALDVMGPN